MDEFPADVLLIGKKLEITPEETEALAVELTNVGVTGSQAGSTLRKVMIKILNLEEK